MTGTERHRKLLCHPQVTKKHGKHEAIVVRNDACLQNKTLVNLHHIDIIFKQTHRRIGPIVNSFRALSKASVVSAEYATANPSVGLSVCPTVTVRHTPVLCQNERTQKDVVFTIG